ncbi:MAG TPA: hypothetical protein DCY91_09105 [Cyanobacteria bacterium UBA11370]|nr:hypothetical protein [Cyanobacteria bacterium UBA11370]HBY78554.1 hypothetical protein [Cyanobacteria bacterium UBA11148]
MLVVGCWLLVVGCWLSVVGCWLSINLLHKYPIRQGLKPLSYRSSRLKLRSCTILNKVLQPLISR